MNGGGMSRRGTPVGPASAVDGREPDTTSDAMKEQENVEVLQRKVCSYPTSLGSKGVRATGPTSTNTALDADAS